MSHLYLMRLSGTSYYKIGRSVDPASRLRDIGPGVELVCSFEGAGHLEADWHTKFASSRLDKNTPCLPSSGRTEWFELSPADLEEFHQDAEQNPSVEMKTLPILRCKPNDHRRSDEWWSECRIKKIPFFRVRQRSSSCDVLIDLDTTYQYGRVKYEFTQDQQHAITFILAGFYRPICYAGRLSIELLRVPNQHMDMTIKALWQIWMWCRKETM